MLNAEIVIPCFNEEKNIKELILQCRSVTELSGYKLGFILVNNGSSDQSNEIITQLISERDRIKHISLADNQGYGGGILAGLRLASAPIIGWTHADLQTPLTDCLLAVNHIQSGHEFVKGKRRGRRFTDRYFSKCMGIFESLLFRQQMSEINAQPNVFRSEFFIKWKNPPTDFSLDLYALVVANRMGMKIHRFQVRFLPRQYGKSNWNIGFRSRMLFIKRTFQYSFSLRKALDEDI
jgi:glycosyltransferase involved in cell wall biosynthesis